MSNLACLPRAALALVPCLLAATGAQARPIGELRVRLVPPGQASVDLAKLSYSDLAALVRAAEAQGELVLPLPFAGKPSFAPIEVTQCELALDERARTLVVGGSASVRGHAATLFVSATFPKSGAGQYAVGIRPEKLALGGWLPALASSPLGGLRFPEGGFSLASIPHRLPASPLVGRVLGAAADAGVEVAAGLGLCATVAADTLPGAGPALALVGLEQGTLRVSGTLGADVGLFLGGGETKSVDVTLCAELDAAASDRLRARLPAWIRPKGATPSLELAYASGSGVSVGLSLGASVDVAGESRDFRLSGRVAGGALELSGESVGAWSRPLGIDWLTLDGVQLVVSGEGGQAGAKLHSTLRIGQVDAQLDLVVDGVESARLEARLPRVTVGDLAAFVAERAGSSFLADLELGDAAALEDVVLTLARSEHASLELAGKVALGGAKADLLFTLAGSGKGKLEPLFALRKQAARLSDLIPALSGKPADLAFPDAVWTLSPPKRGGATRKVSSAKLGPTAREFFGRVYGAGNFELELQPGIQFGATLAVSKLPPAALQALGIADANASLRLDGSLAMSLDLQKGRPSASVESLELRAALPRVAGAASRLPDGLPAWMRVDASSQRTVVVRYAAPSSVAFLQTNDVLADLDGATRHFRVATELAADSKQGRAQLSGSLVGEWKQPFGLKALSLRDVTISAGASAATGGGARSGSLRLAGGFDLGAKSGRMELEIAAASGRGVTGAFTGTLDDLGLDDLPKLDLFPNLPKQGLDRLRTVLGNLPPLEEPTLRVELGGGQPSVALSARLSLRGARANLLAYVGKGKAGPQAVIGLRPENFSLAQLLPKLGQNPLVAPIANLSLERFGLFAVHGEQTVSSKNAAPPVREFFAGVTGETDFELALSPGLNLEARLAPEKLPAELKQVLQRLNQTMGLDAPAALRLRGTLAANLSDLRLAAALPPIRPARAPKWLKSGELAFVLTGTPSFMLAGTLVVDCEGDLLNLMLEGGVERQGGNVAIALKGALQAQDAWESPFGLKWLEIRRFSGQLSIDALANVGFGGGGDVTIGSKDIKVFAWTKINSATGVPMGLVINGESRAGFALRDLAAFQANMRAAAGAGGSGLVPLDRLPDIALRECQLLIASRAVPEEGIDSAGFRIRGDLYIPLKPGASGTKFVAVDCGVSKEGILARGSLGAFQVGPLTWEDAYVDLEATLASQHLLVHGDVALLGSRSATDLQLSKEKFSFQSIRELRGVGKTELFVESVFDLSRPTFRARGRLDNEFGQRLGASSLGELTDLTGKAAAVGAAALEGLAAARGGLEKARTEAGIPTAGETLEAIAAKRVKDAQADADAQKRDVDAKWRAWQDTPKTEPARRKVRELAWGASKIAYDQGPLSKLAILARRKEQHERIHAGVAALEQAKAENERVQKALGTALDDIASYSGKTIVVKSASIESSLDGLAALADGVPLQMSVDVDFCGKPKSLKLVWVVGKPKENAQALVAALLPAVHALVHG